MQQVELVSPTILPDFDDAMTLQVGLTGKDRWVLASDTLQQNVSPRQASYSSQAKKLQTFRDKGIVVGYAGLDPDMELGFKLRDAWKEPHEEVLRQVFNEWVAKHPTPSPREEMEIIVGCCKCQSLQHCTGKAKTSHYGFPSDKVITGTRFLAPFVVEHFYSSSREPVGRLIDLAALTIWYGEQQGHTTVRGLQVVTCIDGKLHELDDAELATLKQHCERLHDDILEVIRKDVDSFTGGAR